MRNKIQYWIAAFLLISTTHLFGQIKPIVINKIAKDLYVYETFNTFKGVKYAANSMFLVTEDGIVLFDVPWQKSQYQTLIDTFKYKFKKDLIAVFVTHFHEDRAGDLSFYIDKNIPTYATAETNFFLKKEGKATSSKVIELGHTYQLGSKKFIPQFYGAGHTKDNIVVWFPQYKILDGGCLVKSAGAKDLGNLSDANTQEWPSTIRKIQRQYPGAKMVIPGHDDWKKPNTLQHTLKLLAQYNDSK